MSAPLQRARHSTLPEGDGATVTTPVTNRDVQRDLWEFMLPYGHLKTVAMQGGGGVIEGLRIGGLIDAAGLSVGPGLALTPDGRLLWLSSSRDGDDEDFRVRLVAPPAEGGGTDGLARVEANGVRLETAGLSGETVVVLEWNESRIQVGGVHIYRHTPWLHIVPAGAQLNPGSVVLGEVRFGSGAKVGLVDFLRTGSRRALTTLRDGLTLSLTTAPTIAGPREIKNYATAGIRARLGGGLDIGTFGMFDQVFSPRLSIDDFSGHIAIGSDLIEERALLRVAGPVFVGLASEMQSNDAALEVEGLIRADRIRVGFGTENPDSLVDVAGVLSTAGLRLEGLQVPLIRAGQTDVFGTPWQQSAENQLFVRVDTSSAEFPETPLYFTSIQGSSHHTMVTGVNAIHNASPTSFELFIRTPFNTPLEEDLPLTAAFALERGWQINWMGVLVR